MKIVLGGPPGSGKGVLGDFLAKKYKLNRYSVGGLRRDIAKERGITLAELNKQDEKAAYADSSDKIADDRTRQLDKEDNFIIDGRLAFHFIPSADVKIFLLVNPSSGAKRIMKAGRLEESAESLQEAAMITKAREDSDIRRYKKLYHIENYSDPRHYDLMIDTTKLSIDQVNDLVVYYIKTIRKLV